MAEDALGAAGWAALGAGSPQLHTGVQWQREWSMSYGGPTAGWGGMWQGRSGRAVRIWAGLLRGEEGVPLCT